MIAASYPFLDVLWTMVIFFIWILWFSLLFNIWADIFRRHDISGFGKTGWLIFTLVLPFLGVFIYLIAEGKSMGERRMAQMQAAQSDFDAHVREVAASQGPADQIAKAKSLLDAGTIDQAEFDRLKAQALG